MESGDRITFQKQRDNLINDIAQVNIILFYFHFKLNITFYFIMRISGTRTNYH